jgi:hypothetical protein
MDRESDKVRRIWARQGIGAPDVDYARWDGRRAELVHPDDRAAGLID